MHRTQEGWMDRYREAGALWVHDGIPERPHALLTSGKHSNGFFNSELVMEDPLLLDQACADLIELLAQEPLIISIVDRVVGPAMGAITLAHDLARHIGSSRGNTCRRAYTEKEGEGIEKRMFFKKTSVCLGEKILFAEDVITTGGSVGLTADAAFRAGATCLPVVMALVNRSGLDKVDGKEIIALINHPMPMWTPAECPLCKQGSKILRPKGTENWTQLKASYEKG